MGYEKDVAAIVKAIEDHKKASTYDPMALVKQTVHKKFEDNTVPSSDDKVEMVEETDKKHHLTNIFLSNERQTILLSATLTKVRINRSFKILSNGFHSDTVMWIILLYNSNFYVCVIFKFSESTHNVEMVFFVIFFLK